MKYKVKIENGGMGFEVDEKNLLKRFSKAQKVLDSEVLRRCDPYVPMDTGMLKKSGILGTVIGSGKIVYTAPMLADNIIQTRAWAGKEHGKEVPAIIRV